METKAWGFINKDEANGSVKATVSASYIQENESKTDGKITSILALHIASNSQQLEIFSSLSSEAMNAIRVFDGTKTIDRNGKLFYLTNFRARLIVHLSSYITKNMPGDLTKTIVKEYERGNFQIKASWPIEIKKLALQVYHGRSSRKERANLLRELYELATTRQAQIYESGGKKKAAAQCVMQIDSIMGLENPSKIPEASDEELENVDAIEITFGRLFFIGLHNRYAHVTERLLELWGVKGNGTETELFAILVTHLLSEYWKIWSNTQTAKGKASRQAKADGKQGDEKKEDIKKATKKARFREIAMADINSRLRSPYKPNKRSRFLEDLNKAFLIFEEIGLIEKGWLIDKKQCVITFHYNDRYGQELEEYGKTLEIANLG